MRIEVKFEVTLKMAVHAVLLDLSGYDTLKTRQDRFDMIMSSEDEFRGFLVSYLRDYGMRLEEDLSVFRMAQIPEGHRAYMAKEYWTDLANKRLAPWFLPFSTPQEEW